MTGAEAAVRAPWTPRWQVVLTCEHADRWIPERWWPLFEGRRDLLHSHRGWDPGSLELGIGLAKALGCLLVAHCQTRLLVDTNRGEGRPGLFSELTRDLGEAEHRLLLDQVYRPHRQRVMEAVTSRLDADPRAGVIHLGIHTFTPTWDGVERPVDVALLYDPERELERGLCQHLMDDLARRRPDLRGRHNEPYRGVDDGLTTTLREHFPAPRYLGLELEVNQRFPLGPRPAWRRLRHDLGDWLADGLAAWATHRSTGDDP